MLDARHFQFDLTDIMRIDPMKKRLPPSRLVTKGKPHLIETEPYALCSDFASAAAFACRRLRALETRRSTFFFKPYSA